MLDKKVNRRDFLLLAISSLAVLAASKLPGFLLGKKKNFSLGTSNNYGNHYYGGRKA